MQRRVVLDDRNDAIDADQAVSRIAVTAASQIRVHSRAQHQSDSVFDGQHALAILEQMTA
jgi:hypothetical protein